MAYGNTPVTATVPDGSSIAQVLADVLAGGGIVQAIKKLDPTAGSTSPIGTASNPENVRPRRRGTVDYDTGIVSVQSGAPIAITSATIYVEAATLTNDSDQQRTVRWTNTADVLIGVKVLEPRDTYQIPVTGAAWVGLKIGANGDLVSAHFAGAQ